MTFVAGQKLRASELNNALDPVQELPTGMVARNQRTSNSSTYTSIARIISVRAPVVGGRTYKVQFQGEEFPTGGDAVGQTEMRYTTDDTEPLTSSTIMARALVHHINDGVPDAVAIVGLFHASSDGFLRVVICGTRVIGTATCAMAASASFPATLTVEDVGDTIAVSGTVY